jgi:hypothetical protein
MSGSIITAGTNRTQQGATLINEDVVRVDVSTAVAGFPGDGVLLRVISAGTARPYTVINNTANPIQLYASFNNANQAYDTINGVSGLSGIPLLPGVVAYCVLAAPGAWHVTTAGAFAIGLKSSGVLAQSAVPASVTGTTTETVLATITIPANAMGLNGAVRVTTQWSYTNSANTKTVIQRFAGATARTISLTATASRSDIFMIANRNAANSQVGSATGAGAYGTSSGTSTAFSVDTTQAQNITLTGTLANTSETITLESYTVEILNP